MGKKSKRVRKKQTKEEWEESQRILKGIVLESWLVGFPYMSKKGLKKKTKFACISGIKNKTIKIKGGYTKPPYDAREAPV